MADSENVATVRRYFDLMNRGEFDELADITPADFVLDRSRSRSLENRSYRGGEEVARIWREMGDAWRKHEFFEVEMIDAGDTVIRVGGLRGRGRGSGVEVEARSATVWRIEEGVPVSASLFQTKEEALADAGLADAG